MEEAVPLNPSLRGGISGNDGSKQRIATFSEVYFGAALPASANATVDEEGAMPPPKRDGSHGAGSSTGTVGTECANSDAHRNNDETGIEQGPGGKEEREGDQIHGKLSFRAWKLVILALWGCLSTSVSRCRFCIAVLVRSVVSAASASFPRNRFWS